MELSDQNIQLNCPSISKEQTLKQLAEKLTELNFVKQGYEKAFFEREKQTSTFLGNGIAIPHGTVDAREMVLNSGVAIMQFPNGIKWDENNTAFVVIALAAKNNEHLEFLAKLTDLIANQEKAQKLANATSLEQFIAIFNDQAPSEFEPIIAENIELETNQDLPAMQSLAITNLQNHGYIDDNFACKLKKSTPLTLGCGIFLAECANKAIDNGIAIVRNVEKQVLIVITSKDHSLDRYALKLLEPEIRQILTIGNQAEILQAFTEQNQNHAKIIVKINNQSGLHLHPATLLVNAVKNLQAQIKVRNLTSQSQFVELTNAIKLISLKANFGTELEFSATGIEATQALEVINQIISNLDQ